MKILDYLGLLEFIANSKGAIMCLRLMVPICNCRQQMNCGKSLVCAAATKLQASSLKKPFQSAFFCSQSGFYCATCYCKFVLLQPLYFFVKLKDSTDFTDTVNVSTF